MEPKLFIQGALSLSHFFHNNHVLNFDICWNRKHGKWHKHLSRIWWWWVSWCGWQEAQFICLALVSQSQLCGSPSVLFKELGKVSIISETIELTASLFLCSVVKLWLENIDGFFGWNLSQILAISYCLYFYWIKLWLDMTAPFISFYLSLLMFPFWGSFWALQGQQSGSSWAKISIHCTQSSGFRTGRLEGRYSSVSHMLFSISFSEDIHLFYTCYSISVSLISGWLTWNYIYFAA